MTMDNPTHNPLMPRLRVREDGWTGATTRRFLSELARTGCVGDAARVAGMSRTSVTRSRRLFPEFDTACAEALSAALRGLEAVAYDRAVAGRETVVIRNGKEVERRIAPSDSLLKLLIQRGDMADERAGREAEALQAAGMPPALEGTGVGDGSVLLSWTAFQEGWRFDLDGGVIFYPSSAKAKLGVKLRAMQRRVAQCEIADAVCRRCGGALTDEAVARFEAQLNEDEAEEAAQAAQAA